jgi:hypothetical protein
VTIKRYDMAVDNYCASPRGNLVLYDDHAAALAANPAPDPTEAALRDAAERAVILIDHVLKDTDPLDQDHPLIVAREALVAALAAGYRRQTDGERRHV